MTDSASDIKRPLLLIEDEQDTADLVTLIVQEQGYHVRHIADGQEALELIALMLPPSLVLLDIELPNIDGVTILDTIRATPDWQSVPVIMLTAVSDEPRIRKILSLKVKDYVLKPFKREHLLRSITQPARASIPPS